MHKQTGFMLLKMLRRGKPDRRVPIQAQSHVRIGSLDHEFIQQLLNANHMHIQDSLALIAPKTYHPDCDISRNTEHPGHTGQSVYLRLELFPIDGPGQRYNDAIRPEHVLVDNFAYDTL
eukprot:scaffold1204_cov407-Prasinococcus_capsulatus_cf.AAC.10